MRTDIHRPSAPEFDPQAYECYGVFDLMPDFGGEAETKARRELIASMVDKGYRFGSTGNGGCGHCGANLRYAALMIREDVKEMIYVGETCLDNRFSLTAELFQKLRSQAKLNKDREVKSVKRAQFIADNVEVQELIAYEQEVDAIPTFLMSLLFQLEQYGELSEKQIASIRPAIERDRDQVAKAKIREIERQALIAKGVSAPEGKVTVIGEVIAQKWQENDFGGAMKMLVQAEEGYKVWVTRPTSIFNTEVGDKIQFTATLTQSREDVLFAYGKSPSKAVILVEAPVEGRAIVIREEITK